LIPAALVTADEGSIELILSKKQLEADVPASGRSFHFGKSTAFTCIRWLGNGRRPHGKEQNRRESQASCQALGYLPQFGNVSITGNSFSE